MARVPSIRACNHEHTQFEIQVPDINIPLFIMLPPGFPSEAPQVTVGRAVGHPWVDSSLRVMTEKLRQWNAGEESWIQLDSLVLEIVDGVRTAVPHPAGARKPAHEAAYSPTTHVQYPSASPSQDPNTRRPSQFPELDAMTNDDLVKVLTSKAEFDAVVGTVAKRILGPQNRSLTALRASNAQLAEHTKTLMEECKELANQNNIIRVIDYKQAKEEFDIKDARQKHAMNILAPAALLKNITDAAKAVDEQSERILGKLTQGDMNMEVFLEQYTKMRKMYHVREMKRADVARQISR